MVDTQGSLFDKFGSLTLSRKFLVLVLIVLSIAWGLKDAWFSNLWIDANTEIEFVLASPHRGFVSKALQLKAHRVIDEGNSIDFRAR